MKQSVFISSVQKELAEERRALKSYILGDALLGRFFDVFLFEDMPAADRRADKVYLDQVDRCDVYLGLLGNEYGYENDQGVSPTEREFDRATAAGKQRLIFADRLEVWNPGELPSSLTLADLRKPHASIPHNPLIADPMFLAAYAEKAGSGILDMMRLCRQTGLREPAFRMDGGQFVQTLWRPLSVKAPVRKAHDEAHDGAHDEAHDAIPEAIAWTEQRILEACRSAPQSTPELLAALGYAMRTGNFKRGLTRLLSVGLLEPIVPGKPRSKNQKYRLTDKGRGCLTTSAASKSAINRPKRTS